MKGLTLDAGALIAFERRDRLVLKTLARANENRSKIAIPVGVIGQVWRDGRTQTRLSGLLKAKFVELVPLDAPTARRAGELCGRAATADVIDAAVVLCARTRGHSIATSDPDDLRRLDASLHLVVV